jgi:hypothetical protein
MVKVIYFKQKHKEFGFKSLFAAYLYENGLNQVTYSAAMISLK